MKRIQSLLILALGMLFISTSCSVEKRLHSTGYHIDWHNNNDRLQQKELIIKDKYKSIISTAASSTNSISKIKSPVFTSENQVFAKAAKEKKIQPSLEKIKALANTVKEETLLALQGRGAEQPDPKSSDADYDSFALTGFILAMSGVLALVFWPLAALLFILSIIFSAIGL